MTIDDLKYTVDEIEDKNEIYEEEKVDENGDVVVDKEGNPVTEERERVSMKGRYAVKYQDIFVYNLAATKELHAMVVEQNATIQDQTTQLDEAKQEIAALKQQVQTLLSLYQAS